MAKLTEQEYINGYVYLIKRLQEQISEASGGSVSDASLTTKGVVKMASAVADSSADSLDSIVSTLNQLLSSLRTAGILQS